MIEMPLIDIISYAGNKQSRNESRNHAASSSAISHRIGENREKLDKSSAIACETLPEMPGNQPKCSAAIGSG